jgi:hypothetical protein
MWTGKRYWTLTSPRQLNSWTLEPPQLAILNSPPSHQTHHRRSLPAVEFNKMSVLPVTCRTQCGA